MSELEFFTKSQKEFVAFSLAIWNQDKIKQLIIDIQKQKK
jgi:hypothetical protein